MRGSRATARCRYDQSPTHEDAMMRQITEFMTALAVYALIA
jgi:hypothetical protein